MTEKKVKITFSMPKQMNHELRAKVIEDGYGMRGKSLWVQEAVESLFSMSGFEEYVHYSDDIDQFDAVDSVMFPKSVKTKIDEAVVTVRLKYPAMEGVQSRILRAAILQRLFGHKPEK